MVFFLKSVGFILVYLAAAKLGLEFGRVNTSVTIFWPPGGIALAMVLLGGLRYLPGVLIAAWLSALMVDVPPIFAIGSALGNTLETWLGYTLLTQLARCDLSLKRIQDLFALIILAGLVASAAGAVVGTISMQTAGMISSDMVPAALWRWWRGDVLGIAFFTPLILLFAQRRPYFSARNTWFETATLWFSAIVAGQMIFLAWLPPGITLDHPPQMAWLIPFLFWAGLRTGRRNTVLIQLMFLLQAMASAHLGVGLFANHHGLANFWAAAFTLSLLGLSLAILTDERLRSALQIALHAKVFALSTDGIIIVDAQSRIISVNAGFTRISGYALSDVQGKKPSFYASGRHDRAFYHRMWTTLVETGQWQGEIWNRSQSGALYLINLTIQTVMNANGEVVNRIGMFSNITESRAIQEAVTHQAQHDFLTGLPNRQLFSDRFGQQLAHARRNNAKFAVIYLDLDGFKSVNDTLGHTTGDQLLIAVAQRLQAMVREIDTVSRFGGDEFAMLVSEVSHNSDVTTMADKVLTALAEPYLLNDHTVRVTASLGLAIYPYHGNDMDSLINAADAALLEAKVDGKNAWQLSDFELTEAEQADVFARNASNARGY